ncbi:MAG: hypothetical protein Cons2KO_28930 [Congregibacter sp.]
MERLGARCTPSVMFFERRFIAMVFPLLQINSEAPILGDGDAANKHEGGFFAYDVALIG